MVGIWCIRILFRFPLSKSVLYELMIFVLTLVPSRLVAAAVLVEFWLTVNSAIWITVFGLLMILTSSLFIRVYGELEFGFSMMKIALIVGVNIMVNILFCLLE